MLPNIPEIAQKCKNAAEDTRALLERRDIFLATLIVLVAFASFGLGRLSAIQGERGSVTIEQSALVFESVNTGQGSGAPGAAQTGQFVGSKNSDKYHYPWCSGASRIKESNKIWFTSKKEAEAAGYSPAGNCKGI